VIGREEDGNISLKQKLYEMMPSVKTVADFRGKKCISATKVV
jgi:hypothetical protein